MPQTLGYIRITPLNIEKYNKFEKLEFDKLFLDHYDAEQPNKQFQILISHLKPKDQLIVQSMHCIAENFFELNTLIQHLHSQDISINFYEEELYICKSTSDEIFKLFNVLASFEVKNYEKLKAINKKMNKKKRPKVEYALLRQAMSLNGATYRSVARQFNVGIATVQRAMKQDI